MRLLLILAGVLCTGVVWAQGEDLEKAALHHVLKVIPARKEVISHPELADCKVFVRKDGMVFRVIDNKTIRAGGHCPSDYVDGKLVGSNQIEIAKSGESIEGGRRICTLNNNGGCIAIRFLDNPLISPTTVFDVRMNAAARRNSGVYVQPKQKKDSVLLVGPPSELIKFYNGDWSTCRILYVPDGTPYMSRGKLAAVSGSCPPHRFVPAKMLSTNTVLIGNNVCVLNKDGMCLNGYTISGGLPLVMPNNGTVW